MRKKKFTKFNSLSDKKCEELHTDMVNRNRKIKKTCADYEKQTEEHMKRLKKQKTAAMKRIKKTCKEKKSIISYYN